MEIKRQTPRVVDEQSVETLYSGHFRLDRLKLQHEKFEGGMSSTLTSEVLRTGKAVAVLLYDPVADAVVLIEQFRVGAQLNRVQPPWILECVAGMVDEGEAPHDAARREVKEETGCTVGPLEQVGSYLSSPGITDELVTLFVGQVDASRAGGVHGEAEESEDIRSIIMSRQEAVTAADTGAIINMVAQVALLWFARHGDAVRERWLVSPSAVETT